MLSILELKRRKRELIERYSTASDWQAAVQVATTLLPLALLWWAAGESLRISPWLTVAVTAGISLLSLRVLVLMHECGHGSLFRSAFLNRAFGFLFGVLSGMPQYVWSQHHDFHHSNNGNWEKYRGPLTTQSVREYGEMSAAQQRKYRRARNFLMAPLGGFVYLLLNPRLTWLQGSIALLVHVVRAKVANPEVTVREHVGTFKARGWKSSREYWHMFWNNIALLALWAAMSWAIGPGLFFAVYVASISLAGGAGIALFTVQHNFEHAHATDSARWDYDVGALRGTSFLVLPAALNWFTANIAYHHIHHLSAKIPNYSLAACHHEFAALFVGVPRISLSQIPRALKCILWDEAAERIISVAEYERQQHNRPAR